MDAGPWMIIGTIVGARAWHVIQYWPEEFAGKPWTEIFMIQHGGLVYYGGFIGAAVATIFYLRWRNLPIWKFGDAIAPSIPVGYVLGRIGCLMNGCCYGKACDLPWAIRFPSAHDTGGAPVHPAQIYDALLSAVLWGILEWLYRRKRFDGEVFASYLIGYAICRFIVEFFRGDYPHHYLGGWATPGHLTSILIFVAGLVLWFRLPKLVAKAA